jgi:hypothetical protein
MEVRRRMFAPEHLNDNSKELADRWHKRVFKLAHT